ncbi:MAG: PaaI family thioesterase [Methanosarcinales archaeon]|nr:PaaI family thioesterase [Methanosarcinales archaeon]
MSYLEEIKRQGRDANPFFVMMGIDVVSFGQGQAELTMEVRPEMMNGAGWMQGGLFTALCDEAMALALFTVLEEGEGIATVSESTSFVQGVRKGYISATGRVIRKGRRIVFTEGEAVRKSDGALLSRTTASFVIV